MRYLLLCCHEEKKLDSMSKSECDAIMEETVAYCEALKKSGHLIGVEALESIQTAMAVRVRNGKLSVTDAPFAETRGQVGGYFLIEARDFNEAIRWPRRFRRCGSGPWRCGRSGIFKAAAAQRLDRGDYKHAF